MVIRDWLTRTSIEIGQQYLKNLKKVGDSPVGKLPTVEEWRQVFES